MSENESVCPSCRIPLQRAQSATGLRFQCPTCQGVIITLAVFRRALIEGVGSHVWVRSGTQSANGQPCGFCGRAMRPTPVPGDPGRTATVEVCRVCEVVWVPADQEALLPLLGSAAGSTLAQALPPTRCPDCGAPFQVGADGCCPYCHRSAGQREPEVVFIHDGTGMSGGRHDAGVAGDVVGTAAGIALGFLFGG